MVLSGSLIPVFGPSGDPEEGNTVEVCVEWLIRTAKVILVSEER